MGLSMVQGRRANQPRRGTVTQSVLTPRFSSSFVSPHCLSHHGEPFLGTGRGFPQELTVTQLLLVCWHKWAGGSWLLHPAGSWHVPQLGGLQGGTHPSPGPLTLSCRAACSSFSSCRCFSCDCAMALLCSSESSFRARCSWTILLAISHSCQGKIPPVQERVRACLCCPGLCLLPIPKSCSTHPGSWGLTTCRQLHPVPIPPPQFLFGSGFRAQGRLGHWVKDCISRTINIPASGTAIHSSPWVPSQPAGLWGHGQDPAPHTLKERSPFSSESWLIFRSIWAFSVFRSWHCLKASCRRPTRL